MVILTKPTQEEIACFEQEVVTKARELTDEYPLLFAGPRSRVYNRSKANGMYLFQYGQFFKSNKVMNWEPVAREKFYSCLVQVLLALRYASENRVLPTYAEHNHLLTSQGAVMIDIVGYLSAQFSQGQGELFSSNSPAVAAVCLELLRRHVPDSPMIASLESRAMFSFGYREIDSLIVEARQLDPSVSVQRVTPVLLTLSLAHFTLKEYLADVPNWLNSKAGEVDLNKCTAKVLVRGTPARIPANRFAKNECMSDPLGPSAGTNYGEIMRELIKNIVYRLKVKLTKDSLVSVAALDCTKGLTQITLDGSGLNNVPSIEELQVHLIDSADRYIAYAHDANPELDWAPIVKISKNVSSSPLDNFKAHYYKVIVLIVRVSRRGGVRSVTSVEDIFRSVPIYCSTDF